jgi:nitroreductase
MEVIKLNVIETIESRRSIRKFKPDPIPSETLRKILEAGRLSPSAGNRQPYKIIVVTDEKIRAEMSKGRYNKFIKDAPVVVVGCDRVGDDWSRRWSMVDTTIALEHIVLTAWSLGVGSCWIGDFSKPTLRELLEIPQDYEIIAQIALGFPEEVPNEREKKPFEELVCFNKFC